MASSSFRPSVGAGGWSAVGRSPCSDATSAGRPFRPDSAGYEVFDEQQLLEGRPCADPVRGVSLFRPELHGLVRARPAGGADCRRPATEHPAARDDGRHADPRRRRTALPARPAGRSLVAEERRHPRPGHRHRRPRGRLAAGREQLCAGTAAGVVPRLRRGILRRGPAARIAMVPAATPGQGHGHRRRGQLRHRARRPLRPRPGRRVRLEQRVRLRPAAARPDPPGVRHGRAQRPAAAGAQGHGRLPESPRRPRQLVVHVLLQRHLRRLPRPGQHPARLFPRPVRPEPGDRRLLHRRLRLRRQPDAPARWRPRRSHRRHPQPADGVHPGRHLHRRGRFPLVQRDGRPRPVRGRHAQSRCRQWRGVPVGTAALPQGNRRDDRADRHGRRHRRLLPDCRPRRDQAKHRRLPARPVAVRQSRRAGLVRPPRGEAALAHHLGLGRGVTAARV